MKRGDSHNAGRKKIYLRGLFNLAERRTMGNYRQLEMYTDENKFVLSFPQRPEIPPGANSPNPYANQHPGQKM